MWVITQDGNSFDLSGLYQPEKINDNEYIVKGICSGKDVFLGKYSTEDLAYEVCGDIMNLIYVSEKAKFSNIYKLDITEYGFMYKVMDEEDLLQMINPL